MSTIRKLADRRLAVLAIAVAGLSVRGWLPQPSYWSDREAVQFGFVVFAGAGIAALYITPPGRLPLGACRDRALLDMWLLAAAFSALMFVPDFHWAVTNRAGTNLGLALTAGLFLTYAIAVGGAVWMTIGMVVWAFYRVLSLVGLDDQRRAAWCNLNDEPLLFRIVDCWRRRR